MFRGKLFFHKKGKLFVHFLPPLRPLRTAPLRSASSRGLHFFPLFSFLFSLFSAPAALFRLYKTSAPEQNQKIMIKTSKSPANAVFSALSAPVFHSSFALLFFLLPMFSSVFSFFEEKRGKKREPCLHKALLEVKRFFLSFSSSFTLFSVKIFFALFGCFLKNGCALGHSIKWSLMHIYTNTHIHI